MKKYSGIVIRMNSRIMGSLPIDLTKLKELPFEPKKEPWNEYELEDGTTLKFRIIVVKFFDSGIIDPLTECPNFVVAYQTVLSILSEERGPPSRLPINLAEIPEDKKEEVEIAKVKKEDWNVYIVDNEYEHLIKPVIIAVYKLKGFYDPAGYPIYHVKSQNIGKTRKLKTAEKVV